ncbi:MAG TPA: glycerol kinase GlpK [Xanthobacteraceae bacterium]|jgi:glycerol kinase|nr:glycerol kinase GlpK [Xanthobacteraceae bacterium]
MTYILAIDQGTTSSRAIVFRCDCSVAAIAQQEFAQRFPQSGWVEHDPEDIWRTVLATSRDAIGKAGLTARDIAAIGIANQRETVLLWDRATGKPIHNAIVWQDRRTAPMCRRLKDAGAEAQVAARTGLLLDPYFSASKIAWLLDHVPGARARAERGELAFGTVDSFLLWRLTAGAVHATDATNASRTALYDIHANAWSDGLCALFGVPRPVLPDVRDCAADYGLTAPELFGASIPIRGIAGDQQAALIGQACFLPGMMKSTYGTGCFAILNTGATAMRSRHRLLSTIAYRLGGATTYGLEGAIFVAGAAVQWLRDGLRVVPTAAATGPMAEAADAGQDVILVPAFVGLGAPHWDADARGALFGLTRDTGPNELARAALESVCFQTLDLLEAMRADCRDSASAGKDRRDPADTALRVSKNGSRFADTVLRVDGGMVASDWTMQRLADILAAPVDRPTILETTALGAAYLAGLQSGLYPEPQAFAERWALDRRFTPAMDDATRGRKIAAWKDAVGRTLSGGRPAR